MRLLITTAVLACVASVPAAAPASAQTTAAHYCAYYNDGSINCGFDSFDACATAVSGVGGVCRLSTFDDIDAHATAHPADRNAL